MVANVIHSASERIAVGCKRPLAQLEADGRVADDVVDDFHINNNMFDESQLWLRCSKGGKRQKRVLAAGCQVTRRKPGGSTVDLDIIRPPSSMECYTAATCASILAKPNDPTGLLPSGAAAPKAKFFASMTATDSHSVNKLLSKWISKHQGEGGTTHFHVPSYCTQHKTGNAVQQVTEYLGLIRPGFALAACLQAGDIAKSLDADLEAVLEQQLEVVDPATVALDAPDDTQRFLRELLEQCHVGPLASGGPLASDSDGKRSSRAEEADAIVSFFAASRHKRLRHACPDGCCANRNESIKKAHVLVRRLVVPCISEPAANKYTKVDPVIRKLAIACNFFGLLRRAFARKFKENGDSESEISSDAALGAPRDANRHWRKVKHIKLNRSYTFLKQRASEYLPLIWLCVCSCIMVVHYKLFKNGTWFSHRSAKDRCNIFDFCSDTTENPICEALSTLASMLLDPEGTGKRPLALLYLKFGERYLEWPRHVRELLQGCLCIAFQVLWRKLYYYFQCYPWLLVPAFDVGRTMIARRDTIQRFLNAFECCLDPGLCAPLRAYTANLDDYFGSVLHDFLITLFERVVVTSTQVELQFASLTRWTMNHAGMPTIAAKYAIDTFAQMVGRWRTGNAISSAPSNRCRPPWVYNTKKGVKTNHLHVFAEECHKGLWPGVHASEAWTPSLKSKFDALPKEEQEELCAKAKLRRQVAKAHLSPLDEAIADDHEHVEGPLGLAAKLGEPFPMRPSAIGMALKEKNVLEWSREWSQMFGSEATPLETFPSTVVLPEVCVGGCKQDFYVRSPDGSTGDMKQEVRNLSHYFQLACRFAKTTDKDPTIVLRFNDCDGSSCSFVLIAHHCHDADARFEATCFAMRSLETHLAFGPVASSPVGVASSPASPVGEPRLILTVASQCTSAGCWPQAFSEQELLRRLLAVSPRWEIFQAITQHLPAPTMSRLVTAIEPLSYQRVLDLEEEAKTQKQAMKLLRQVMRRSAPNVAHAGNGQRVRKKTKDKPDDSDDITESDKSQDSEVEDYWKDIMKTVCAAKVSGQVEAFGQVDELGLDVVDAPLPPPALPPLAAGLRRNQRGRGRAYVPACGPGSCFYDLYTGGSLASEDGYANWTFLCPKHEACQKTRGVGEFSTRRHGKVEPLAFLHAWRDMDVPIGKSHRRCAPTMAQVDEQVANNYNDFLGICSLFGL